MLCTGKISIDLLTNDSRTEAEDVAIIRIEQLYPFPDQEIQSILARYPNVREIVWVQEEPRNMGAWSYLAPRLQEIVPSGITVEIISRPDRSSPAAGFIELYEAEQEQIIKGALCSSSKEFGGNNVR